MVFSRLGDPKKIFDEGRPLSIYAKQNEEEVRVSDDLRSAIPSRMKQPASSYSRPSGAKKPRDSEVTTSSYHITVEEIPDENEEGETNDDPKTLEDGGQSTVDELKELNLGTNEDPRPIYVSALLTKEEEEEYYKVLVEYKDVFAWSYKEMPGLSPKIAVHRLAIKKGTDALRKKNGQLRICVDFRDRNDACPKDDFPLLVTELMIDATTGHEALSFMDCTAGYNQIHMAPEDQEATGFRTTKGIFCYTVMPFRLKNASATYQRAMQKIFDDMLHKTIECYVDDVAVLLKQYDLVFVPQKAVKGQAIADFFANHPVPAEWEISYDLPGEEIFYVDVLHPWQMYFDCAARQDGAGGGVVFVTPQNHLMPYAFTLTQLCTNNMEEYQALILGLQMAIKIGVRDMDIYGDSKLVVNQVLGEYEVKKEDLIPYHQQALQLLNQLDDIHVCHVPMSASKLADVLANLAATLALGAEESMQVRVCNRWVVSSLEGEENVDTTNMICVYTVDEDDWRQPIIDFLDRQKLPDDPRHKVEIRRRAPKFIHYKGTLYRRSFSGQWLRCLSKDEATEAMHKAHSGICGTHQSGPKLHDHVKRMGYGVPQCIISDNGKQFFNHLMTSLGEKFKFKQYKSSMYNASANGLAEAFNKTLCNLLRKVVAKSKQDWHERIGETLWAYRTTYKTPTQATPYALVYGVEAMLPLELQIPSLRIVIQEGLTEDENDKLRLAELEALDEKRLEAQQKLQCYQARLSRAFNKKVRPRSFQVGDLVLAIRRTIITYHKPIGKFTSKWNGPYVVQEVYINGAYKIVDEDGVRVGPINGKFMKRYYS
ncbi:uncharacterized protein LOC141631304 [Silene latifolia]|uniref:uncharacterized protein LOC141631304 n=1 Tax=Silene latifolia TaxID=37657 RepID=UPI003D784887